MAKRLHQETIYTIYLPTPGWPVYLASYFARVRGTPYCVGSYKASQEVLPVCLPSFSKSNRYPREYYGVQRRSSVVEVAFYRQALAFTVGSEAWLAY